ncbi:NAD-dependent epimerase/dehydratase family protein [Candidatus Protochlamydia amoebophila]|uniref:Putative dTDP-glucose 4,6-dehydratase, rfbB n=1 Tax=Candidatus Protochlamydia amoebophila TaxID=362787 RepID=A0A0C1JRH9_9BACT|nr:NAD-dependent epimerase/dehydratase family protein [Candidatus Protochlamydia amoebophila]KIC73091.1 putative dTDP-glucose 4,6-dehydratase, rfbB [Candidatus Protochlamydia amoebophila]
MLAITGTSGFIGKYICPYLPFPQKKLFSSSVSEYILDEGNNSKSITFPPHDLSSFIKDTSTLIHLACKSNPRNAIFSFQEDLTFTTQLFEHFAQANPNGHIIFASTGGNMYSSELPHKPRTEKDSPSPNSIYSVQKLAAEHYLRLMCQTYGISATVLRISNPYGTLLEPERLQGLIGIAFNKILFNQTLTIFDSSDSVRDYIHLEDLASVFQIVSKNKPLKGLFSVFNIGCGIGYSIQDVIQLIEKISNRSLQTIYSELANTTKPSWSVLSHEYFHSQFGWRPQVNLEKGLEKMWNVALSHSQNI